MPTETLTELSEEIVSTSVREVPTRVVLRASILSADRAPFARTALCSLDAVRSVRTPRRRNEPS